MRAPADFIALRDSLAASPIGDGGVATCQALTAALDTSLVTLAGDLTGRSVAMVALGGYGRREQCLYSDIDLMVLHDGADLDRLVHSVMYPLWDANLKVGHSFRTVGEAGAAARDRFDSLTSLLSGRLVAGDEALFAEFASELTRTVSTRPLGPELARLEAERRQVAPYQLMAADLKEGRGALRTFQGFWWERRRAELLGEEPEPASSAERQAFNTLLAVRNGLHAASGRAQDRYVFEMRDRVAAWLESDVTTVSARLSRALALGDRLAEERWPPLLPTDEPLTGWRGALGRRRRRPEDDGPKGAVESALQARPIRAPGDTDWTASERDAFVRMIGSGTAGRAAFARLESAGWIEREFPEWEPVMALPQLAPFHEHPTDAHLWRTADEMTVLLAPGNDLKAQIVKEIGADDVLLLSAFLHDIGKGRGGDHSELGARAAEGFLTRAGYGPAVTSSVAGAIRHHLLLLRTATRRDIANQDVLYEVVAKVRDMRQLQLLYLLTIADAKATGPAMWSEWKETLLTQFYMRLAGALRGEAQDLHTQAEDISALTDGRFDVDVVERHLSGLPHDYRAIMSPDEVAWHLETLTGLSERTSLAVQPGGDQVLAVGRDRRGFLLAVCQAFAAHGIGIRDARIYTRNDGIAIDTFHVYDDRTHGPVNSETWPQVGSILEAIESKGLDVTEKVRHRAAAYAGTVPLAARVIPRNDLSTDHLVLEVRATDRIGLLADIVRALYDEDLDLKLARIDTRGNEAIDVLYLARRHPPRPTVELSALCARLESAIRKRS